MSFLTLHDIMHGGFTQFTCCVYPGVFSSLDRQAATVLSTNWPKAVCESKKDSQLGWWFTERSGCIHCYFHIYSVSQKVCQAAVETGIVHQGICHM